MTCYWPSLPGLPNMFKKPTRFVYFECSKITKNLENCLGMFTAGIISRSRHHKSLSNLSSGLCDRTTGTEDFHVRLWQSIRSNETADDGPYVNGLISFTFNNAKIRVHFENVLMQLIRGISSVFSSCNKSDEHYCSRLFHSQGPLKCFFKIMQAGSEPEINFSSVILSFLDEVLWNKTGEIFTVNSKDQHILTDIQRIVLKYDKPDSDIDP